jgi:hypothetical protein
MFFSNKLTISPLDVFDKQWMEKQWMENDDCVGQLSTFPAFPQEFQPVLLDHVGGGQNLVNDRAVFRGGQVDAEMDGH